MSSSAVAICKTKTGDPGGLCETVAALGATDSQLETVTNADDLNSLLMSPALTGSSIPNANGTIKYVPSTSTYLVGAALTSSSDPFDLFNPDLYNALADPVESSPIAQAIDNTVDTTIPALPGSIWDGITTFLKTNIIWIIIILVVAAGIAAIILNPEGVALAGRAAIGG